MTLNLSALTGPFSRTERTVGAAKRRRYDLPLSHSVGSAFLVLLVGMMTFLALLALSASFALGAMGQRWTSGLENKATIEIPATESDGKIVPPERLDAQSRRIAEYLAAQGVVTSHEILKREDVARLVEPWLGGSARSLEGIPLPALIALTVDSTQDAQIEALEKHLRALVPRARIDTHRQWLSDLLDLTHALKFASALLVGLTVLATVVAVAGGVRSRMAENRTDIEILHMMGAGDDYISRQFQRHAATLALKGSLGGLAAAAIALFAIGLLAGETQENILPDFSLSLFQMIAMAASAPVAIALAWFSARWSVLRTLAGMP